MTFEQSMEQLEKIVKALESGELPIEASIAEFEKGVGLVKECRKLLDDAQQKITTLLAGEKDGSI